MKKKNFILLCTLCTALLFSCNKEIETEIVDENPEGVVVPEGYTLMEFTAVCEETKTALDGSGNTVWSEGDQIKIICSDYASNATLTAGAGSTTGTFAGMVPNGKTALYAVYPASAYASVDGSTVNVTVPASQSDGSFGAGNIAVAKVEADHSMSFKNVTSLFSFTLAAGSNVTKVEISSVGNVGYLAGVVPVDCSEEETPPTPGVPSSGTATSISMATNVAGTYYMPIVSGSSHSKGLLLRFYKTEKNAYVQTGVYYLNRSIDIVNNNIYGFGTLETAGNYYVSPDGSGDKSGMNSENPMSFAQFKKKVTFTDNVQAVVGAKKAAVNGSTFHFSNDEYSFDSQLVIDMGSDVEFSIMGTVSDQDRTTFTCVASNKQGMIQVNSNTVNINNIKITGNSGNSNRAAIRVNASNATLNLSNCVFDKNATGGQGGAIWINKGVLNITDCAFTDNIAGTYGGAIYIDSSSNSTVEVNIDGGVFKGNHSGTCGGAICSKTGGTNVPTSVSLTISDSTFGGTEEGDANYSSDFGGAIGLNTRNTTFTCSGTSFYGNYISYSGDDKDGGAYGGAIALQKDQNDLKAKIDNCIFTGNYCSYGAPALSYQSSTGSGNGDGSGYLRVTNTSFTNNVNNYSGSSNTIAAHGGAVRLGHDATPSYFYDCTFQGNRTNTASTKVVSAYGGAVTYYADGMSYFDQCHFENNCAVRGGAISSVGCTVSGLYLNGCSFSGNWISYSYGTTMYIEKTKKICINNCSIADDTYSQKDQNDAGCWLYLDGATSEVNISEAKMEECVISNCSFIGYGRKSEANTSSKDFEIVYVGGGKTDKHYYLINNLIVTKDSSKYSWWSNKNVGGNSQTFAYNNIYTRGDGNNTNNKSSSLVQDYTQIGSPSWDSTNHVWTWSGTIDGSFTNITATEFATNLNTASSSFKAWLEDIDPVATAGGATAINKLNLDALGNPRGNGSWRPGAYQGN